MRAPEILDAVVCATEDRTAATLVAATRDCGSVHVARTSRAELLRRLTERYQSVSGCPDLVILEQTDGHGTLAVAIEIGFPGVRTLVCDPSDPRSVLRIPEMLDAVRSGTMSSPFALRAARGS